MPDREPLSGPDNAWRRMGTTENLMTITGILMLEDAIEYEELCDRLEERLLRFDRFKQRIGGRKRRIRQPYWETVENFDVHTHVYEIALPEPVDEETFEEFIGKLMSRPLDERRPLWEAYLVKDAGPGDGDALAVRINHSIGDGFALLYVMLGLVDNPGDIEFPVDGISAPPRPDLDEETERDDEPSADDDTVDSSDDGISRGPETTDAEGVEPFRREIDSRTLLDSAETALKGVKTGVELLVKRNEPETSLYGELGQRKHAAWTDRIDLNTVKTIGSEHDATVNDVLLAAMGGAVRRVLEQRGERTDGLDLRFTVPVNLKPMNERGGNLGNHFGLVFAPIPVGTRDFEERIALIHERMDVRKAGIEAFLMYQLLNIGGHVPEIVQDGVMTIFEKHATGIATNVPGPLNTVEFVGTEVTDLIFWVPQANDQGIGISIISYDGNVRVGVASDANLLSDPYEVTDAFETEIEMLLEDVQS